MSGRRPLLGRVAAAVTAGVVGSMLVIGGAPAAVADTYSSPATGTHSVVGAILDEYRALRGPQGRLGHPVTDELPTPQRFGRFNHFQHGSIYWSPGTGAHELFGAIRHHWASLGWENGFLGFPTSDEFAIGGGIAQRFERGSVYWSPATGAHVVLGAIHERWVALGQGSSYLGFPVTDEIRLPRGAYQLFQGGAVYWSPASGAHAVRGYIAATWAETGWENGPLGFPVSDENALPGGASSHFQGGTISWSPETGARVVFGAIRERWAEMGWEESALGRPVSDEYSVPGGRQSDFEHGSIVWTPLLGAAPALTVSGTGIESLPLSLGRSRMIIGVAAEPSHLGLSVSAHGPGAVYAGGLRTGSSIQEAATLVNADGSVAVQEVRVDPGSSAWWTLRVQPLAWAPLLEARGMVGQGERVVHYVGPPATVRITSTGVGHLSVATYSNRGELIWLPGESTADTRVLRLPQDVYLDVNAASWQMVVE